ncbi:MAG TPA: cytochrome c biogenesis protein CcmE [Flexistipes sinusarabici]|uniref:Cytochrome c biogenesis protein CcmE n=1 Tax=Flexistipes sinusarabici TaxID=2352 RepID=A0A3D5QBC8_FLESI|nr:cytochrome c biogenesis protein CcmE [Flexistipes sinusarabici]
MKKSKFLIAGLIVVAAVGYLIISGFNSSSVYYLEVSELVKKPAAYSEKGLRVSGDVKNGTVQKDVVNQHLEFVMSDKKGSEMNVVYNGIIPDAFNEDVQVIVEGEYSKKTNTFKARTLLAKCPSKYEAKVEKKS